MSRQKTPLLLTALLTLFAVTAVAAGDKAATPRVPDKPAASRQAAF